MVDCIKEVNTVVQIPTTTVRSASITCPLNLSTALICPKIMRCILLRIPLHLWWVSFQFCGTGAAGTATFCHSGTGAEMHSGSGIGFAPGSNIKYNKKVEKNRGQLSGNNAAFSIEKARFYTHFCSCWKTVVNKSGFGTGTGTKMFPKMNRNRNKSLQFHSTDAFMMEYIHDGIHPWWKTSVME